MTMLNPKEITVTTLDGVERAYIISKFPATVGRDILTHYVRSGRTGEYQANEAMMLKIMGHVAVKIQGRDVPLVLSSTALVNNHVPDWKTLLLLEKEVLTYNAPFLADGRSESFLSGLREAQ